MMKILYLVIMVLFFGFNKNSNNRNFELQILDKHIIDGKLVNVKLKNNTKFDYCFIMDTIFYERDRPGFDPAIRNTKIILLDRNNNEVPLLRDINLHYVDTILKSGTNTVKNTGVNPFRIITLKSGKCIKLKVPFNLIVKYKYINQPAVFQIDSNQQYQGRVEYMIQDAYLKKYISEQKKDSLNEKGFRIFTGTLKSNKVPLVLKR